jgi:hypothetical protein
MSVAVPGDDNVGQDLLFNNNPAVNGASSAVFTLRPGLCPVGSAEPGGEGTLDDAIDGRVDLTRDLGVIAPAGSGFAAGERARRWLVMDGTSGSVQTNANTFATWSQTHALGGPNDDADEDGPPTCSNTPSARIRSARCSRTVSTSRRTAPVASSQTSPSRSPRVMI